MKYQIATATALGAAALGWACASNQGSSIQPAAASAVYGSEIVPTRGSVYTPAGGMWVDSVGGAWMDGDGTLRMGGQRGMAMGLQPGDVANWNAANIFAHLAAGDSLEIQLSQSGAASARNQAVRDFAQRMVSEHSAHLQTGLQLASQNGITPTPAVSDTADAGMAMRVMNRLNNSSTYSNSNGTTTNDGANGNSSGRDNYDRRLMGAEVMMHQHMLHELTMLRSQASGPSAQLIDQTIPIVRLHLTAAQALWQQVGGGQNRNHNPSTTGQ
jgi:Domain of unknown function (DUF4142)